MPFRQAQGQFPLIQAMVRQAHHDFHLRIHLPYIIIDSFYSEPNKLFFETCVMVSLPNHNECIRNVSAELDEALGDSLFIQPFF